MNKSKSISIISFVLFTILPLLSTSFLSFYVFKYQSLIHSFGYFQWILVSIIFTIATAFALCPPTFLSVVYGYFLGFKAMFFLVFINFGAIILVYIFYKTLKFQWITEFFANNPKASSILNSLKKEELKIIFFTKLSPVLPFAVTNLLFAVSGAKLYNIILGGFLGMLPRTALAVFSGSQAKEIMKLINNPDSGNFSKMILIVLVLVSLFGLIYYIKKTVFSSKNFIKY